MPQQEKKLTGLSAAIAETFTIAPARVIQVMFPLELFVLQKRSKILLDGNINFIPNSLNCFAPKTIFAFGKEWLKGQSRPLCSAIVGRAFWVMIKVALSVMFSMVSRSSNVLSGSPFAINQPALFTCKKGPESFINLNLYLDDKNAGLPIKNMFGCPQLWQFQFVEDATNNGSFS